MRLPLALACVLVSLAPLASGQGSAVAPVVETRVALVIGNQAYKDSPLHNPVNDAKALGATLRRAGFDVIELHDQGATEMRRAIRDFGERLRGKGAGLFYYAGHGVQIRGRNYLVPVNADIKYEDEVEDQSVDIGLVLAKMESAKARVNLVILDACRNNPYASGSRGMQNGLASMDAPIGTLIAFATSPGQVADDGARGRSANGLFTQYLVREIERPGLKVEDVLKRVRGFVRAASNGRQIPWENTSLEGDFYFYPPVAVDTAAVERERQRQQEEAIQQAVASAVSRSREEAEREKKRLEQFYAEKLEADRAAFRKEALERIAALERTAVAAAKPEALLAASAPAPAPAVTALSAPLSVPRPAETVPEVPEPVTTAAAPAETSGLLDLPPSFQLALGLDSANSNKLKPVAEDVARGLKPPPRAEGDRWIYYRQIRDGEGIERRNYLTQTVTFASDAGFTTEMSDSPEPWRFDADGNRYSGFYGPGNRIVFDPVDPLYRFPLVPGQSWSAKTRELSIAVNYEVDSQITVVGREEVTVPAGKFQAIKISKVSNRNWEPFPGQITRSKRVTNVWYVPALRNFARAEGLEVTDRGVVVLDQTWELDSFDLR